jgi:Cof subfamily protein (haloacid dehalogenase superfamily)
MTYKIVFLDIDGTILNTKQEIPVSTKQAVNELKEKGIDVVIATGRSPYHAKSIADELHIDSFVTFNGSFIVYKGRPVFRKPIPLTDLQKLYDLSLKNNHSLTYLSETSYFTSVENDPFMVECLSSLHYVIPSAKPLFWKEESLYQVHLNCLDGDEQSYVEQIPDLDFVRWHRTSLDVIPKNSSKASGIEELLQQLNISKDEAVAFGDGLNDKEMIDFVGMGIAMGNAHEELKPLAKLVTSHVDEDGILNGLKKIGLL